VRAIHGSKASCVELERGDYLPVAISRILLNYPRPVETNCALVFRVWELAVALRLPSSRPTESRGHRWRRLLLSAVRAPASPLASALLPLPSRTSIGWPTILHRSSVSKSRDSTLLRAGSNLAVQNVSIALSSLTLSAVATRSCIVFQSCNATRNSLVSGGVGARSHASGFNARNCAEAKQRRQVS
jgi:hypothetical protein